MGFHHVALATNDIAATHHFYTVAMGFDLVKAEVAPTPEGGWAKHVFYETGGDGLIAFWDLHVERIGEVKGAMSTDLGLPAWVNHLAFDAADDEAMQLAFDRWSDVGLDIFDITHSFCRSIYTTDPNGTLVEWCQTLAPFSQEDREHANSVILASEPGAFSPPPDAVFHPGDPARLPVWGAEVPATA